MSVIPHAAVSAVIIPMWRVLCLSYFTLLYFRIGLFDPTEHQSFRNVDSVGKKRERFVSTSSMRLEENDGLCN